MNTPAHAVLNLALLERGASRWLGGWVVLGAIGPDLPNALFFAGHRLAGMSTKTIYAEVYGQPMWQAFLAPSHSFLVVALIVLLARWRRHAGATALALSMAVHLVADLLTHGTDAHPHLWPLSEARFVSPISYWDVAAGARWFVPAELAAVVVAAVVAAKRAPSPDASASRPWWRLPLVIGSCAWLIAAYAMGWAFWGSS